MYYSLTQLAHLLHISLGRHSWSPNVRIPRLEISLFCFQKCVAQNFCDRSFQNFAPTFCSLGPTDHLEPPLQLRNDRSSFSFCLRWFAVVYSVAGSVNSSNRICSEFSSKISPLRAVKAKGHLVSVEPSGPSLGNWPEIRTRSLGKRASCRKQLIATL